MPSRGLVKFPIPKHKDIECTGWRDRNGECEDENHLQQHYILVWKSQAYNVITTRPFICYVSGYIDNIHWEAT